ncbi:hypothetical protein BJ138DRAFT_803296 [Hygrophoropsis aurantiaca]|uniref:Uncharacterized protein n=1 Tax=Hygrophoropsis aurantiaca TaxID=72124 RepID=A0ACB8AGF1_9AGAM|nr:hypothetical protein BJ138DRAFT_803296 [Hygrophoropsis aurantiaca]
MQDVENTALSESDLSRSPSLHRDDYLRYGRQMILEGFGLPGQAGLQRSSVVVVGAGGLGCPALQYLAASGVGRIGIIDHDMVELSNLQRQILHNESTVGVYKAISAAQAIQKLNSKIQVDIITEALHSSNAIALLYPYNVILDCTDNAPTRYLLSDTAVSLGKPLVSGAAQKFEGQLSVYNFGDNGPCYRCIFPRPPAMETVGTCEETGVLGAVTGVIGTMQALETIRIITGLHDGKPTLLLYSALTVPFFRSVKLRSKKPSCIACGGDGVKNGTIEETDYVAFCGGVRPNWEQKGLSSGSPGARIRVQELKDMFESNTQITLIDVRPTIEFGICQLSGSKNVPLPQLLADPNSHISDDESGQVVIVCRLGNDSQIAADTFRESKPNIVVKDVIGGLRAWSREIDPLFPIY